MMMSLNNMGTLGSSKGICAVIYSITNCGLEL